ncbi:hypothetical protein CDAR_184831 [Caerostris darwini]|uniref:Uncharacterized protein n=1 Tax=Caerostris darwini TaxID=1538125 RepID=A0AAV4SRW0_9ARAC|nr:hypothetical protein CDAR_184831 [Caerostris darwini]
MATCEIRSFMRSAGHLLSGVCSVLTVYWKTSPQVKLVVLRQEDLHDKIIVANSTSYAIAQTSSPGLGHQSFDSRSMTTKWGRGRRRELFFKKKRKNSLRKEGDCGERKRRKPTGSEKIASCSRRS